MTCRGRAEQPSTGRGEDTLCRTTAQIAGAQHVITSSPSRVRAALAVAGLRCRLGSSYQKAPRSEPNFAKLTVSTPTKSTICDRLGYLDRARDLGTESCIAVHSKSLNSARRRTRRTRPRGVAATQRWARTAVRLRARGTGRAWPRAGRMCSYVCYGNNTHALAHPPRRGGPASHEKQEGYPNKLRCASPTL